MNYGDVLVERIGHFNIETALVNYWRYILLQKHSYKPYSKAFKEEAVALVRDQGYSVPEAVKLLDVANNLFVLLERSAGAVVGRQWAC